MGDINNIYFIMYVILDKMLSMEEVKRVLKKEGTQSFSGRADFFI